MTSHFAVDFVAGSLGGAAGVLTGHPFDTVKVRLQTQSADSPTRYSGHTFSTIATIARVEGARGLYKGLSSPLTSVAFLNAIIFSAHGRVIKLYQSRSPTQDVNITAHFMAGATAGSAQALIASPMELLKLRVQLCAVPIAPSAGVNVGTVYGPTNQIAQTNQAGPTNNLSPYRCFKQIIAQNGLRGLTRGLLATQLRDFTGVGTYFASYELMTRKLSHDSEPLNSAQLLLAGGIAGTVSWLCNYPVDVVKTRFQADDNYKNYAQVCYRLYAEQGLRSFLVGLESTLIRAFPTNAATFFTVEWTYRLIHKYFPSIIHMEPLATLNGSSANITSVAKPVNKKHWLPSSIIHGDCVRRYVSVNDLWQRNSFLLPEAGSTSIDPMIVCSQHYHRRPQQMHIVL